MTSTFRILLTTSSQTDEDATGYIVADWGSAQLVAEPRLMQFQSGDLTFTFVDRGTDKAARYWSQRIMRSTTVPTIKVLMSALEDGATVERAVFFGWVERSQLSWDGEPFTRFTAMTQLSYADRLDCADRPPDFSQPVKGKTGTRTAAKRWRITEFYAGTSDFFRAGVVPGDWLWIEGTFYTIARVLAPNEVELTEDFTDPVDPSESAVRRQDLGEYSGHATPLVRRLLRSLGNVKPPADAGVLPLPAEVLLDDFEHGETQADTDWVHPLRTWAEAGADPATDNALSEFVPSVSGDRLGFCCVHGKLYRVDIAAPSGTTNRRGLRLVEVNPPGVTVTDCVRLLPYRFLSGKAVSEGLLLVRQRFEQSYSREETRWLDPNIQTAGSLAMAAGILASHPVGWLASMAVAATMEYALTQKRAEIRKQGDKFPVISSVRVVSIDAGGTVGAALNSVLFDSIWLAGRSTYSPVDSVATTYTNDWSEFYYAVWFEAENRTQVRGFVWDADAGTFDQVTPYSEVGVRPQGGMAAVPVHKGTDSETHIAVGCDHGVTVVTSRKKHQREVLDYSPSRFIAATVLDTDEAAFILGNHSGDYLKSTMNYDDKPILDIETIADIPDDTKILNVGHRVLVGGARRMPCLYSSPNDRQQTQVYAGEIVTPAGGPVSFRANAVCVHPLPNAVASDLRPPMLYADGAGLLRFLVAQARIDREWLVVDMYQTSRYYLPFVHHRFDSDPMSVRQALEGIARAAGAYVRLVGQELIGTGGLGQKIVTRHSYSPKNVGYAAANRVGQSPRVEGVEYYLGVTASVGGEQVEVGDVSIPAARHVFSLSSPFLTAAGARALGAWIVAAYPEPGAGGYPDGRRRLVFDLLRLQSETLGVRSDVVPQYADIGDYLTFEAFRSGDVNALLMGLGPDRGRMAFGCHALEYDAAVDATWTANESDITAAALDLVEEDAADPPVESESDSRRLETWDVRALPSDTPVDNPADGPCVYAFTVWLPQGLTLTHMAYLLTADGDPEDGGMFVELWTDDNGKPGAPVSGTRAMILHDGLSAGLNYVKIANVYGEEIDRTDLAPGLYWMVVVVDRQDAGPTPIVAPPIVWLNALVPTPRSLRFSVGADYTLVWISEWDAVNAVEVAQVPAVYAAGEV